MFNILSTNSAITNRCHTYPTIQETEEQLSAMFDDEIEGVALNSGGAYLVR